MGERGSPVIASDPAKPGREAEKEGFEPSRQTFIHLTP